MSIHIIIDGYNLIRQSGRLRELDRTDLQLGRETLLADLAAYQKLRAHRITVVFDGMDAPFPSPEQNRYKGIGIRFSRRGETADHLIGKMVRKDREKALVVSSDREIIQAAARYGAASIGANDFEEKLIAARLFGDVPPEETESTGWIPTTRKKGPRKRPPRRDRKNRTKIQKL
jgi:uncharacterized protein